MTAQRRQWRTRAFVALGVASLVALWNFCRSPSSIADPTGEVLSAQREALLEQMGRGLDLAPERLTRVRELVYGSPILGQGNPRRTVHPMTREECWIRRAEAVSLAPPSPRCNAPNMVAIFDPARGETAETATLCIDQYEFPNLPCEYPVVHVRAREAALLCEAVGKRLCDAHEWEGACAGAVRPIELEYAWGHARSEMTRIHNRQRERVWATGTAPERHACAMDSTKTAGCGGGFERCGSNTYPAGAFPECVSPFGVYDQHGNVAEHMNLPLRAEEVGREGGLGHTEMKGSWFIFGTFRAHEDDCRWRASDWHPSRVRDPHSHSNYHLGFRCCKELAPEAASDATYSPSPSASAQQRNPVE